MEISDDMYRILTIAVYFYLFSAIKYFIEIWNNSGSTPDKILLQYNNPDVPHDRDTCLLP